MEYGRAKSEEERQRIVDEVTQKLNKLRAKKEEGLRPQMRMQSSSSCRKVPKHCVVPLRTVEHFADSSGSY